MNDLPPEMLLAILEFFDIKTLVSFIETSHFWHSFIHENARSLVQKVSCEYKNAPLVFQKKFVERSPLSPCTFFIDSLGRLQGEVRICEDSFSFKDGKLNGEYNKISRSGQNEWIKESGFCSDQKFYGTRIIERNLLFEEPEHLLETQIWNDGELVSHSLEFEEGGSTTIFSSCGERECEGEMWFCYKKTTKTRESVTEIEYIDGKRFVTVNGQLLEGPREKGEAWSQCCEKHQGELPDSIC
uniref:F-box containing protein n=1 Tax=Marseillevirus sp. TaxID=2809551 RepID=A0AA96EM67_9VIRU|nr:F-box containing protein [Marseillevirus sp.]